MSFEEILRQALDETAEERSKQMLEVPKKHRFSLAYKLWERKTLRNLRRNRVDKCWTLRRARYITATIIAVLSLLVGVTAYAAISGRLGFKDKVDYSKVLIEAHPSDKTVIEEYYGLPEEDGWVLINRDISNFSTMLEYKRGEIKVTFDQMVIQDDVMGNISTDRAKIEMLSLYEENDGFLMDFGNGNTLICWIYDGYLLKLFGNIDKSKAINLAHSTKIVVF